MIPAWLWRPLILIAIAAIPIGSIAQTETPAYEVVSVRENHNPDPAWRMEFTADGVSALDVTLEYALQEAFGLYDERLWSGGPAWMKEKRFDIDAKFDVTKYPKPTLEQRRAMLQQLMKDRFKLVVHHETKQFPLYALVLAKRGPLFKETIDENLRHSDTWGVMCMHTRSRRGVLEMSGCPMDALASSIGGLAQGDLGRKVVDKTGLKGHFDFRLSWTPMMSNGLSTPPNGPDGGPSIFTAVKEQLGLELKPITGPLDTIVIDHVEMPSEN